MFKSLLDSQIKTSTFWKKRLLALPGNTRFFLAFIPNCKRDNSNFNASNPDKIHTTSNPANFYTALESHWEIFPISTLKHIRGDFESPPCVFELCFMTIALSCLPFMCGCGHEKGRNVSSASHNMAAWCTSMRSARIKGSWLPGKVCRDNGKLGLPNRRGKEMALRKRQ